MRLALDADALAAHRVRLARERKGLRPVNLKIDSDGWPVGVALPGPDWLAAMLTAPAPAYRDGAALVIDGTTVALHDIADELHSLLKALPDRSDAGQAYGDVRLAASVPSPGFSAYLVDTVRAYRNGRPPRPAPSASSIERKAPRTNTDYVRASRARLRTDAEETAAEWLAVWLDPDDDPPAPGRFHLADLHAQAVEAVTDWLDDGDLLDSGRRLRVPGVRVFARVLDQYLGGRTHTARGSAWDLTPETLASALSRLNGASPDA